MLCCLAVPLQMDLTLDQQHLASGTRQHGRQGLQSLHGECAGVEEACAVHRNGDEVLVIDLNKIYTTIASTNDPFNPIIAEAMTQGSLFVLWKLDWEHLNIYSVARELIYYLIYVVVLSKYEVNRNCQHFQATLFSSYFGKFDAFMSSPAAISIDIVPEFKSFDHSRSMTYIATDRPWLKLYGIRVPPVLPFSSLRSRPDPALIHQCLPDELLTEIFARMSPYTLGRAATVCRKWKYTARSPILWRNACLKTWQRNGMEANHKMVQSLYDSSWRKMWVQRPRIRNDGIYVSRNTYIHTGVTEWQFKKTVNVVCYYRYLRFYPSGKFLYKISAMKIKDVVKCMHFRASKGDSVFKGDYTLSEDSQIEMALLYPGHRYTLVRMRLRVRGTTVGSYNRLDVLKILTTGVNGNELGNWKGNILELVEGWEENETHDPDVPAVSHSRGLTPFVFVPFEEADTSVLNLPVEKMDYFVPG